METNRISGSNRAWENSTTRTDDTEREVTEPGGAMAPGEIKELGEERELQQTTGEGEDGEWGTLKLVHVTVLQTKSRLETSFEYNIRPVCCSRGSVSVFHPAGQRKQHSGV